MPVILDNRLRGLVAKILRTYQREFKKLSHDKLAKFSLTDLKDQHSKMLKAAMDLFIDQVRDKIGPFGGQKMRGSLIEHQIVNHR